MNVDLAVIYDSAGSDLKFVGTSGSAGIPSRDSFYSFKKRLDEIKREVNEI